jgi:hypothetical protein
MGEQSSENKSWAPDGGPESFIPDAKVYGSRVQPQKRRTLKETIGTLLSEQNSSTRAIAPIFAPRLESRERSETLASKSCRGHLVVLG